VRQPRQIPGDFLSVFDAFSSKFCSMIEHSMNVEGLVGNAPTRVGKSYTGVTYLLKEHGDVDTMLVSRSINETSNMIRYARKVVDGTPVLEVVGRENFCVNGSIKEMYRDIRAVNDRFPFHILCSLCELSKGRIPNEDIFEESHVLSYRDVIERALSMGVCPARLAYKYARKGVHIITNYSFLVDPAVRESSFLKSDGGYSPVNVFLDEADVLLSSLIRSNSVSFPNVGLRQIVDREITSILRMYPEWSDYGVFDIVESFVDVVSKIKPSSSGVVEFDDSLFADVGYQPEDLDVFNANLREVLTRIKRSYDLSSKIEAFTRVQASSSRGFFIHKILMGVDYLSTDLDGYTLLPEVTPVVDPTGSPTGVGIVRCARYRFYDDGFYMNFRDNVSFLEDPNRWKCFTSATIDPSRFLAWTQVRGSYLKVEFPHVISLSSVPFYCRKRRVSTRSLFGSPRRALEFLNAVLRVFIRRELSCYVGFPSAEIMSMYKRDFDVLPVVKIFADENKPVDDIRQAPIVSKPCAIYFDYCRSRTVRGLDFFNYDVALLVSLPVQNLADWQWEASQLLRIAKRFRDDGLVVSAGNEVLRRAVNEAAQFFSRIYTRAFVQRCPV